jgi:thiamine-monophosphate kinase
VAVDQVLDGVHFDSGVHSPREIGAKVMNRNLSDCAAMACLPAAAVATVALPRGTSMEYAKELYLGMKEAADTFAFPIVGGDTATWGGRLVATVTILGRSARNKPVTRKGARPGDPIFVTGPLGGSMRGRHMTFEPRVHDGFQLGKGCVTAMIDISDGLSRDLGHICRESGVGAIINAAKVPVHDDAVEMRRDGHSPLEHALHDGEDYELLYTADSQIVAKLTALPFNGGIYFNESRKIGVITAEPGIFLEQDGQRTPLEPKGWEHTF